MPTANPASVIRIGCQVAYGVTDLADVGGFPFGGTSFGVIGGPPIVIPNRRYFPERGADDRYAGQMTGLKFAGESWVIGLNLRQWDRDAYAAVFMNYKTVSGGKQLVDQSVADTPIKAGMDVPSLGNLLIHAKNPTHPSILFRDVYPMVEETLELRFSAIDEATVGIVLCARAHSLGMYAMDTLDRLSLT